MASSESSINVRDHGKTVEGKKGRVQCNYCAKEMSGFFRLKCHLGGIKGDVISCEAVPQEVREQFRSMLQERGGRLSKEVRDLFEQDLPWTRNNAGCPNSSNAKRMRQQSSTSSGTTSAEYESLDSMSEDVVNEPALLPSRRMPSQSVDTSDPNEDSLCKQNKRRIGKFFFETGIDLKLVNSPSFQRMMNDILVPCLTKYKIPSCQELKGWILKDEVKEMQEYVMKIRQSWASTGCSILLDNWVDEKGRNLVSFIVDCPQGPIYLHSSDVSASVDDVDALQSLFDQVINEVGVENVVQIIVCSTTGWVGAVGEQFIDRCRTAFWTVDASHCIELMLDKIATMDEIRVTLENAKTISRFIYGHMTVLNYLRAYTDGHDLIKPTKVRSAMPFLTLENILAEKRTLKAMFASSEWKNSTLASSPEGKKVADLVGNSSFWKGAGMAVKIALPVIHVLCLINGDDKPQMGYLYETMDQMKETIREECNRKESKYMPLWDLIDDVWNGALHSPLHAAGHFFNPSLFYATDFQSDAEIAFGLLCSTVRMNHDRRIQDRIVQQLHAYKNSEGAFAEGSTVQQRTRFSPAVWWAAYGGQYPELQRFAIRVLSQTCVGASKYRLNRNLVEKLLTQGRNPTEQQLLSDMIFVHYNLQLQQQHSQLGANYDIVADEIDPMDEWIVDDDTPEMGSQEGGSASANGERPSFQVKEEPRQV